MAAMVELPLALIVLLVLDDDGRTRTPLRESTLNMCIPKWCGPHYLAHPLFSVDSLLVWSTLILVTIPSITHSYLVWSTLITMNGVHCTLQRHKLSQ